MFTEDHRRKIADALRDRKRPLEVRLKISSTRKDKMSKGEIIPWNRGKKCPQISQAIKGDKHPQFGKTPWNKNQYPLIPDLCTCGCKEVVWSGRSFLHGHRAKLKPWNKGQKTGQIPWNKDRTNVYPKELLNKWSELRKGKNAPNWKGGEKLARARKNNKRRDIGTVLITDKNPFNEPTEFHHIHPSLPYVIPVPARIHKMFYSDKDHHNNVNAFMGLKFQDLF